MASMTAIVGISASVLALAALIEHLRLRHYWQRPCSGRAWRRSFPGADKQDIRRFLQLFTRAFAFSNKRRLCFRPDDQPLAVYKALYPWPQLSGDAMELESLIEELKREFGADLLPVWHEEITLGELFAAAMASCSK